MTDNSTSGSYTVTDSSDLPPLTVTPSQPPLPISPSDRDMGIRTVLGEAGSDPDSQAGVAAVIANRARDSGASVTQTVLAKGQFEPWSTRSKELLGYQSDSPAYQAAAKVFDSAMSGVDPTGGATNFYSPSAQKALGRSPPAWDDGTGQDLGKHRFFGGNPQLASSQPAAPMSDDDIGAMYAGPAPKPMSDDDIGALYAGPNAAAGAPGVSFRTAPITSPGSASPAPSPNALVNPSQPSATSSTANALASGFASGVPIVGPALNAGLDMGVAGIESLSNGTSYSNALAQIHAKEQADVAAHPTANALGSVGGAIAGTVPAIMAAPAAFGISSAGLGTNALLGALSGATIGGTDAAVRSGGNPSAILRGAGYGGAGGAAGPVMAKAFGSGVNALSSALSRTTPAARTVANALSQAGMTPEQAQDALAHIGPQATLADIDPALTGHASAVAALGGQPTSILKNAMAMRAAGADNRATDLMNRTLGPKPDLNATIGAIENDAASRAGPHYDAGRNGPSLDVTPLLANIDSQLPNASGGVRSALATAKTYLTRNSPNTMGMAVPKDDPGSLLGARQAIDDMMFNRDTGEARLGPNAMRVAGQVRDQLDGILKTNRGFAAGDAIYSQSMGIRDAMQSGTNVFSRTLRPEDLTRTIASMTPEELHAYRAGARVAIGDTMEQSSRGELAAAQTMFGRGTANRAKLDALFPNAQDALDALHSEATMRATENAVSRNSATAERQATQAIYAPRSSNALSLAPEIVGNALAGPWGAAGGAVGKTMWSRAVNALSEAGRNRFIEGTARGLSAVGPDQQAFLAQVGRAYRSTGATNALAQYGGHAANLLTRATGNALAQP